MTQPFAIINDVHIGVIRSAGTTPVTAWQLRQWALERLRGLLMAADGHDLLVNGDLFDTDHVPYMDLLATVSMFTEWLMRNPKSRLYLPPGNHDLSKTSTTISSQQFFASLLGSASGQVTAPSSGTEIEVAGHRGWVIPHMANQDLFDAELAKVPEVKFLFLHCNYDNKFAVHSDHSLNLSKEAAEKLPVQTIIMGHEHQRKVALTGKVHLTGNQFPTSVADCLGNNHKVMVTVNLKGGLGWNTTWEAADSFVECDWRELADLPHDVQFVRVTGKASASEAAAVPQAIAKVRRAHTAFVITSAVQFESRDGTLDAQTLENVQSFNVTERLVEFLRKKNPAWETKVKKLMEQSNVS